jgi:hypothetical protein
MLSKARWWGVWIALLVAASNTATPAKAGGQELIGDDPASPSISYDPADAAFCPASMLFQFKSVRTGRPKYYVGYANRGGDAAFARVYYSFHNVFSNDYTHKISGNFWVYGWECRMGHWYTMVIDLTNFSRMSYTEVDASPGGGPIMACNDGEYDPYAYAGYDPYDPYAPEEDFWCTPDDGGGGGSEGDSGEGGSCRTEMVAIEISYDDGATWHLLWEGPATVCDE